MKRDYIISIVIVIAAILIGPFFMYGAGKYAHFVFCWLESDKPMVCRDD